MTPHSSIGRVLAAVLLVTPFSADAQAMTTAWDIDPNHTTAQFAVFVSKKVEEAGDGAFRLIGDLTMRGVTREVTLDVDGPMVPLKQGSVFRTGATATTKINRRDFGLSYNRVIEGAAIVGDEVLITIDIEAVQRIS